MIQPRWVIGTPEPPTTRRKLQGVSVLIAHEVGVNTPASGRYRSADPAGVVSDARAAAAYGVSSGRSWEYSYMIGLDGSIFEQAGEYMAQHCLNFNQSSVGVLFMNALDLPNNAAQNAAWHWLRSDMVRRGMLTQTHEVAPHYRYRSTSCPGIRAEPPGKAWSSPTGEGRTGELVAELRSPPPPPQPPTDGDEDMNNYIAIPPPERNGSSWLFVSSSGSVRPATTFDVNDGVTKRDMASIPIEYRVQQYDALAKSAGL